MKGDQQYHISTFASKFGVQRTAATASAVLAMAYLGATTVPLLLRGRFRHLPMVVGHSGLCLYLLHSYGRLDGEDPQSVGAFYKAIWNLFYMEYLLYPFI